MQHFNEISSYNFYMELGGILKELRKEKGLTQTQLAQILCTTQDSISLWELGKSYPDVLMLIKMSKYFGVSCDYLLGLEV